MNLNLDRIKSVTQGIQSVEYENGLYCFYRFTKEETAVIGNDNADYTAGVQMLFRTDGDKLKIKAEFSYKMKIRSYFSLDVFENGELIGSLKNIEDSQCVGAYAVAEYPLGNFEKEFELSSGEKEIRIVFPHSVILKIEDFQVCNASFVKPVKREKVLITYGDSITQGYDSVHPSNTYAMRLAEALNAELFNKGIGGAQFMPALASVDDGLNPDYVTVAYGTNDWNCVTKEVMTEKVNEFLKALVNKHHSIPIFVLSPIWRKDYKSEKPFGDFFGVEEIIKKACEKYESVKFISGFNLVPHNENFFGDLSLHPNDKGFEYYFRNLIKEMGIL